MLTFGVASPLELSSTLKSWQQSRLFLVLFFWPLLIIVVGVRGPFAPSQVFAFRLIQLLSGPILQLSSFIPLHASRPISSLFLLSPPLP